MPEIKTEAQLDEVTADRAKLKDYILGIAREAFSEAAAELPVVKRLPMAGAAVNPEAPGATVGGFKSFAEFLGATYRAQFGQVDSRLKVMGESDGGGGGFLVPEEFRATLLALALEEAVVRPRATVIPMGTQVSRIPAILDTSHATSVFGGVVGNWSAEAGDVSSTTNQPAFTQLQLIAKKLTGYTVASNELLADNAIGLEALITRLFGEALAYFEDDAFLNGTGAGQPLGILNSPALISVAKETNQAANTIVYENIVKMYSRMLPRSVNRAVWVAHPDTFPQLATMALAVGTGGSAVWIAAGGAANTPPVTIFGRPVIFSEKCQTLGTLGDIYFVDFSYYVIGDRQALTMAASPHVRFTTDEMVWRFIQRVDGRPWLESALTPRFGTNTLSPFVALATRA
jgi:HK97 family phage major capsid protein